MTFQEVRDTIVKRLEAHIGCPVILSEQIAPKEEPPYCYYSALAPRISTHAFGLREVLGDDMEGYTLRRTEPVYATMSFTFCGENRETLDGYIYGEDEALALAEKAHGFFLLDAHCISTDAGDIVVNNVGDVANRSGFFVEDTIRRFGFDVRISYIRSDEMPTTTVLYPGNPQGNAHS